MPLQIGVAQRKKRLNTWECAVPGSCRVLVIEDNPDVRLILCEVFRRCGFDVDGAGNSVAGREAIRVDGYDLIVIDVTLPGGEDGFSLAKRAAETPVGVILISGNPMMTDRMETSGHAHLLKPFLPDQLVALSLSVMAKMGRECFKNTPASEGHHEMG